MELLNHIMSCHKILLMCAYRHVCVHIPKYIYTWITTLHNVVHYHFQITVTNLVEEAGSVVCLCMRCVRRRKCSLMESCTSVGMSGDVWLIFTAASRKPMEPAGSFTFSVAMVTSGCWGLGRRTGGWSGQWSGPQAGWRAAGLENRALFRQGTQHSFQETNVRRPSRPKPQTTNTPSRRRKVTSGGERQGPNTQDHAIWTNRWRLQRWQRGERHNPLGCNWKQDCSNGLVLYEQCLYKTEDIEPSIVAS